MQKVCQRLGKLGCYFVIVMKIDSEALGVPLRRPHNYFILVRKDVSITENMDSLASLGNAILKGCTEPVRGTVLDLLLPPQRTQAKQMTVKKAGGKKKAHVGGVGRSRSGAARQMEGKARSFPEEVCLVAANVLQRRRCTWITESASEGVVAAASQRQEDHCGRFAEH